MGRKPLTAQQKVDNALAKAAAALGIQLPTEAPLPESQEDLMREAQSVIIYFTVKGDQFRYETCRKCGETFSYSYHIDGIKYCSIPCMQAALKELGLEWHPSRPAHLRWGRYAPAVVSPLVLESIRELAEVLKDVLSHTSNESTA